MPKISRHSTIRNTLQVDTKRSTFFLRGSVLLTNWKPTVITDEKQGKYIYYELNTSVIDEIIGWITSLKGEEQ